jgi:transposase
MNTSNNPLRDARVSRPRRGQVEMHFHSLDQLLASDHVARIVWAYVERLDLEPLYEGIEVTDFKAGRSAIAPEVLLALWLLATIDGIGSARELARRCENQFAYLWICGGVSVNYHTISDFRTAHVEFLDQVLVDTVASLMAMDLVSLDSIAQDGMRVRASAGKSSFRRQATLEQLQAEAQKHLDRIRVENETESERAQADQRRKAAAERAARERAERLTEALRQRADLAQQREQRKQGAGETTRVSTTDPDARKMKMANGGYDPAYNVQFASDANSRMIVGVDVTNEGNDGGQLAPMHAKIAQTYERLPDTVLVDSAYATKESVTSVELRGTKVVSTVPRSDQLQRNGKDPHERQTGDTDQYEAFRKRMADPHYKELYKSRPSIAEFPNADCRNRNLQQFKVRGLSKVKAVALWHAIAFNFRRMITMGILT